MDRNRAALAAYALCSAKVPADARSEGCSSAPWANAGVPLRGRRHFSLGGYDGEVAWRCHRVVDQLLDQQQFRAMSLNLKREKSFDRSARVGSRVEPELRGNQSAWCVAQVRRADQGEVERWWVSALRHDRGTWLAR